MGGHAMIVQDIYLSKYNWSVRIYYAVDSYYSEEILNDLLDYNPSIAEYNSIKDLMENYEYNTGFTFTNFEDKESLMVIGLTSSPAEFQNTFDHEKGHLAVHVATYYNIDPYGEEFQYLAGSIGEKMFKIAQNFLCPHCKESLIEKLLLIES